MRPRDGIDPAAVEPPLEDSGLFYGADLAYVHDRAFGHVARAGGLTLIRFLERNGWGEGLVVELGSGSGITARLLTEEGYEVLGVEVSSDLFTWTSGPAEIVTLTDTPTQLVVRDNTPVQDAMARFLRLRVSTR